MEAKTVVEYVYDKASQEAQAEQYHRRGIYRQQEQVGNIQKTHGCLEQHGILQQDHLYQQIHEEGNYLENARPVHLFIFSLKGNSTESCSALRLLFTTAT